MSQPSPHDAKRKVDPAEVAGKALDSAVINRDDRTTSESAHATNVEPSGVGTDDRYGTKYGIDADKSRETIDSELSAPESNEDSIQTIIAFDEVDPGNPYQFSRTKKIFIVLVGMLMVINSTLGSSIAAGATRETQAYFHVTDDTLMVLPISMYLVGYVVGPLAFAPLSEQYGRKNVLISTFVLFTAFTLGCALAPSFAGLIVMRLLEGIGASTPNAVVGGLYADIYSTHKARGLVMTIFLAATTWGPLLGPIISGFISPVSWRWSYWALLILAGLTWPAVLCMPETYAPIVLKRRARKLRKQMGNPNILAPIEVRPIKMKELIVVVLTRPVRMFCTEAIVMSTCLYLALVYGIFYMCFQAYPIIFEGIYGFNAGEEGLAFLPIGIGATLAGIVYIAWDAYLDRCKARTPPPAWTRIEEYRRLPLACFGGPLFAISLFWLGWTARADIHWMVPIMSALPFGVGFLLIFMGELNYLVDAYEVFAASATGASACSRSIVAVVLPFAARSMYARLGVAWSCSLLGLLSLFMSAIPFVFIRFGDRIRANSAFCQQLQREKADKRAADESRLESDTTMAQRRNYVEKLV